MNDLFDELKDISLQKRPIDMRHLFKEDPERLHSHSIRSGKLFYDYSKNLVDPIVMSHLQRIAERADISTAISSLFRGDNVNWTEDRAALHMALRNVLVQVNNDDRNAPPPTPPTAMIVKPSTFDDSFFKQNNSSVMPSVIEELKKMISITEEVRSGAWRGSTGKQIKTIINIGIGGSDLGPRMVWNALSPSSGDDADDNATTTSTNIKLKFISNIDPTNVEDVLQEIDWEESLFIVVSKTFTTMETMVNAQSCKAYLLERGAQVQRHFVAVSTNIDECTKFGIQRTVGFWDWVGGRYSVWGAVGLSCMIGLGIDRWMQFLAGGNEIDKHFYSNRSSPTENIPLMMALLGVWYQNGNSSSTAAVVPYCERLNLLPSYLQQLDMESNGKSAMTGTGTGFVQYDTGPIVWGQAGTNGQHAFFQLLHQGTRLCPVDFIVPTKSALRGDRNVKHHGILYANCIAQGEALLMGSCKESNEDGNGNGEDVSKTFTGNRPSTLIRFDGSLGPRELGQLVACYEHKIFCMGRIWGINSFDQWGVELGKVLAKDIISELGILSGDRGGGDGALKNHQHDQSTMAHIEAFKK